MPPKTSYSLHPLEALDGVLVYVALHGETVGFCFGPDERAAAEAVAAQLAPAASQPEDGAEL